MELQKPNNGGSQFMVPVDTYGELMSWCEHYANSDFAPKHLQNKPGDVMVVMQTGYEIGMKPGQALQQIVPINGLPTLKGDGAKALILGSGLVDFWKEKEEDKAGNYTYTIHAKRKDNGLEMSRSFSFQDAKTTGLWIGEAELKQNPKLARSPWKRYPKRMCMYRALGFIARDLFADVTQGTYIKEEALDIPVDERETVVDREGNEVEVTVKPTADVVEQNSGLMDNVEAEEIEAEEAAEPAKEVPAFTKHDIPAMVKDIERMPFVENKRFRSVKMMNELRNYLAQRGVQEEEVMKFLEDKETPYASMEDIIKLMPTASFEKLLTAIAAARETSNQ